jgi:hypothetical protein
MAQLLAEREAIMAAREAGGPSSLAAVVSDTDPPRPRPKELDAAPANDAEPKERVKVRCRACKALNDEDATKCVKCDAEL